MIIDEEPRDVSDYGNNLFLDNINLDVQSYASVDELDNYALAIMPNPASSETTVQFAQPLGEETTIRVMSMDGKLVFNGLLSKGMQTLTIDVSQWEPAVYTLDLSSETKRAMRRIVIQK